MKTRQTVLWLAACAAAGCWIHVGDAALAEDWPTFRHDNQRSAVSAEQLKLPLGEIWTRLSTYPPQPAWPPSAGRDVYHGRHRLQSTRVSDLAFHPVVAGGKLYYGSSADDTLYCVDAATGETVWSFVTEGPIRLAPAVEGKRIYIGSDDGRVYCLDAANGRLVWKVRAGPEDHRLPGNQRIISAWPVRCGVLVDGGAVYFGAGVFPSQGVYLCAARADTGKLVWKQKINSTIEGHLLATKKELYVLTGRVGAQLYDRATGKLIAGLPASGSAFALIADNQFASGPSETGQMTRFNVGNRKPVNVGGRRMLLHGGKIYVHAPGTLRQDGGWQVKCGDIFSLAMVGDLLIAGGANEIAAYNAADGKQVWKSKADGNVYGIAVAGGRLFASTDKGVIHCFGKAGAKTKYAFDITKPRKHLVIDKRYSSAAGAIVKRAGVRKGYCLVLDCGGGQLAYELAKLTQWRIIGIESDPKKVRRARELLRRGGLYGGRVVVHQVPPGELPYQKYIANVITSDAFAHSGQTPSYSAEKVRRLLRPDGGTLVLISAAGTKKNELTKWCGTAFDKAELSLTTARPGLTYRRPKLPGAGDWTHLYGNTANTACSNDVHGRGPLRLQWFGRPGPRQMVDRHNRTNSPVTSAGRVFVSGTNHIVAADAYNGTILWRHDVPDSVRLAVSKDCGNLAAAEDAVYLAAGGKCLAFDAETGEQKLSIDMPKPTTSTAYDWGYVAHSGGQLFGSAVVRTPVRKVQTRGSWKWGYLDRHEIGCSYQLFSFDRHRGRQQWAYTPQAGVLINPTIAVADGRIYFVESTNPDTRKTPRDRINLATLLGKGADVVALDAKTGRTVWRTAADLKTLQHTIFLTYAKGMLVISGSKNLRVGARNVMRYELHALDAATGEERWAATPAADGPAGGSHGEQDQHPAIVGETIYYKTFAVHLKTGKRVEAWKAHGGGCGTVSASAHSMFYRAGNPNMTDLATGKEQRLTVSSRPGCWINIIPAGGLVLVPEASSGCTCGYPIQTSFAMARIACPAPTIETKHSSGKEAAVTISSSQAGAVVRYTTDGSLPTAGSPMYERPLKVAAGATVSARAFLPDGEKSVAAVLTVRPPAEKAKKKP